MGPRMPAREICGVSGKVRTGSVTTMLCRSMATSQWESGQPRLRLRLRTLGAMKAWRRGCGCA
eukprot:8860378-Pyramimonas_sp.AAC.1